MVSVPKKGERMSPEHRARIAAAHQGKKQPWSSGDLNPAKRPEVRTRISATMSGRIPVRILRLMEQKKARLIETTVCACGCGTTILAYSGGRIDHPNKWVIGHHLRGKKRPGVGAKVSAALRGRPRPGIRREGHWNWRGGITEREHLERNSPRYRAWRDAVYARDGWKCIACGKHCQKGNITADHIVPWSERPELRYEVSNGRTLCRPCHAVRHGLGLNVRG